MVDVVHVPQVWGQFMHWGEDGNVEIGHVVLHTPLYRYCYDTQVRQYVSFKQVGHWIGQAIHIVLFIFVNGEI